MADVLKHVFLITPNFIEVCQLTGNENAKEAAMLLSKQCRVYLKGGHSVQERGIDFLYQGGEPLQFLPSETTLSQKHGSGCMLSSAMAAHIALGKSLEEACRLAKNYIEKLLKSNENLLAYHVQ